MSNWKHAKPGEPVPEMKGPKVSMPQWMFQNLLKKELVRSPALAVITEGQCDEIERLRRLEELIIANKWRLEAGDPRAIAKILRYVEFNPRPKQGG